MLALRLALALPILKGFNTAKPAKACGVATLKAFNIARSLRALPPPVGCKIRQYGNHLR